MKTAENISPKITIHGKYALVKFEPGMSLRGLLQIYGISEKRTDLVRSLLSGNNLAFKNTTLTLSDGRPIPAGKVLQMPTRLISGNLVETTRAHAVRAAFVAQDSSNEAEERQPATLGAWETLSLLMQDKATRLAAFGGAAIVGVAIAIGMAASLLPDQSDTAKVTASPEQALQQRLREIHQERSRAEFEARRQVAQERLASTRPETRQSAATVPVGSAPGPVISSLEPGKGDIDMRDVGAVRLSQNSSSAEIVRVIEAYNALPPAKKK